LFTENVVDDPSILCYELSNIVNKKNLRKLLLAKKIPTSDSCKWIHDIEECKDLEGDWKLCQNMGLGIFSLAKMIFVRQNHF
jgi:hypothetical protein